MPIKIAKLSVNDLKRTHALMHSVISSHRSYVPVARKTWERFYTEAKLREHMRSPQWLLLVAKDGERVIGFSNVFEMLGGVARSDWTLVHPDYQKRGVGRALMRAKFKECKRRGCHKMVTDSVCGNKMGKRLMESTGWKKLGVMKKHWFGQDYILWERWL